MLYFGCRIRLEEGEVSPLKKNAGCRGWHYSRLQLYRKQRYARRALNRLPQTVADRALRRLQSVIHDFNDIAQLHDAAGKGADPAEPTDRARRYRPAPPPVNSTKPSNT